MNPDSEVFTANEVARALGVHVSTVCRLIDEGAISTIGTPAHRLISRRAAVRAGRRLRQCPGSASRLGAQVRAPLGHLQLRHGARGVPMALSTALHVALIAAIAFVTSGRADTLSMTDVSLRPEPLRLVYLATPGPGGGGGGGGRRDTRPAPKAARRGTQALVSPLPARQPPPQLEPVPEPVAPPPVIDAEPIQPIVAPVAIVAGDPEDRAGIAEETETDGESHGPGDGGGAGSGQGVGLGEGDGPGIGPGSGGGIGGGPYRPGSGIDPPRLLREVKPGYPDAARRLGIVGDVVLEIVVTRDGTVGAVRMIQRLSPVLDRQAIAAVRQWRFAPATLRGTPVDVLVEVAVEFKQR